MAVEANLEVFADYFQVYLADPLLRDDWSDAWQAPSGLADRFIVRPRILGFCTERNSTVPLRVDHAVQAGLSTTDRRLIVAGCTEYWPAAFALAVRPGLYGAAFLSFELASVRGLEGNDRYELHIWPVGRRTLRRYSPRYFLRVRFKTSSRVTKLSQHEADGGKFQEREGVAVEIFPIFGETATTIEPCDGSFDDPTLG